MQRPPEPERSVAGAIAYARWWTHFWQLWWTRAAGRAAVEAARRNRFDALLRHTRLHSPFYRKAWHDLPPTPEASALPVVTKPELMARFDDWVTDTAIRRRDVDAFLADRTHIGERFLGRYIVWKSSGSTGEPGIYIQDDDALAVYDALIAVQLSSAHLAGKCAAGVFRGGRAALLAATGDHFASIASWERVCRSAPGLAARGFSIMEPLDLLVTKLNAFAPAYVASYPTMLGLLANERASGRLRINPALVWSGGEFLAPSARTELERAFGCPVLDEYGTSECLSIAFGCPHGWLHVNADWVMLEPVESGYRPTLPGEVSHSVLLTNLANRVQPVIRYELGDAVVASPVPCPCGNALPAIRVEGRREDVIAMPAADGRPVRLLPLALTTVVEEAADVHRFQIVHTGGMTLSLRLDPADEQRRQAAFDAAADALRGYLAQQGIVGARIELDPDAPMPDLRSGKLRQVVAGRAGRA